MRERRRVARNVRRELTTPSIAIRAKRESTRQKLLAERHPSRLRSCDRGSDLVSIYVGSKCLSDSSSSMAITTTTKERSDGCVDYSSASNSREVLAQIELVLVTVEPLKEYVTIHWQVILCIIQSKEGL